MCLLKLVRMYCAALGEYHQPVLSTTKTEDFIFLVIVASWMSRVELPWDPQQPVQVLEFFAGKGRIVRAASLAGYEARGHELLYDVPPDGESVHSGMPKRSSYDFCGEAGFV